MNALQERYFYELGLPSRARGWGADVLLMPVNLTARRNRIPQLVTILDVNFLLHPETYDPWFRRYATRMFARAVRDADVITTISDYSRAQISSFLDVETDKIHVTYPGLRPARGTASESPPIAEPYALFLGPTEPHKNIGLLLQAWARDAPAGLRLAIVGKPGRAHDDIVRLAGPLRSRVTVIGVVDEATRERWYRGASVFLFPSLVEGFGYPPLEAMQRGVPVVAAYAGSLPEVLGEAALFHDPGDADELRRLVERAVGDTTLRTRLIASGRKRVEAFRWDATARRMARLLWRTSRCR